MVTVRPAEDSEQAVALGLLFCEAAEPEERIEGLLASARRGEISLSGLLLAEIDGQPAGAGLFTEQPGRVGFVWPPGVLADHPDLAAVQDALLTSIARRLEESRLRFGQVIVDPYDKAMREVLARNGFSHLTDLHYLLCPANSQPLRGPSGRFESETFHPGNADRFARVLEQTYIGTLDCPELDGLRTSEEALAGHQGTGRFEPARWRLFRHEGNDAGILLMNEHPERELWEIVYLGAVPGGRGLGLGEHMVETALAEAHAAGRPVVLAVDVRNHIARRIYERAGFFGLTVQSVHLRQTGSNDPNLQFTDYAHPRETGKRIS